MKNVKSIENEMQILGYRFEILSHHDFNADWKGSKIFEFKLQTDNLYELSDLKENTHYLIRIASRNSAGLSDWSRTYEYSTGTHAEIAIFALRSSASERFLLFRVLVIFICWLGLMVYR